ncbi:MAG: metallophosphoesterase [Gemmatimonadaceae bacterium]|nr:metallophosphoesterase [Gemmatimonadaceae bacterium]
MRARTPAGALRLLHVSDVHFGLPAVPRQVEGVAQLVATEPFDAIIVSGDVSQRARIGEFQAARLWLDLMRLHAPVLVVPGNHDTQWWEAPLGLGDIARRHRKFRSWVGDDVEPVLRVEAATARADGTREAATLVGLLSAHGIRLATLTTNPRHLSVIGLVREAQWALVAERFRAAPAGDARVLVLHHNLRRGRLSNRWGLRHGEESLWRFARSGAELACCGHDHEEQAAQLSADEAGPGGHRAIISCAGTISLRSRGFRPSSVNEIVIDRDTIAIASRMWDGAGFAPADPVSFPRVRHP